MLFRVLVPWANRRDLSFSQRDLTHISICILCFFLTGSITHEYGRIQMGIVMDLCTIIAWFNKSVVALNEYYVLNWFHDKTVKFHKVKFTYFSALHSTTYKYQEMRYSWAKSKLILNQTESNASELVPCKPVHRRNENMNQLDALAIFDSFFYFQLFSFRIQRKFVWNL